MDIIDCIRSLPGMLSHGGVSDCTIVIAENALNAAFAEDYKAYLKTYGAIIADGIELTGLDVPPRTNVVDVTQKERKADKIPQDMYVIESLNIDSIYALQNTRGEVFMFQTGKVQKCADDLAAYLTEKV